MKGTSRLDIPAEELIKALNDPAHADQLMKKQGWNKQDLVKRAELLTHELAAAMSAVNVV
jgi:hypothetical protein